MFGLRPNGIAEVEVKTGSSAFMFAGVAVFGGSHLRDSCCAIVLAGGPSGWYGTKISAGVLVSDFGTGSLMNGELDGKGISAA